MKADANTLPEPGERSKRCSYEDEEAEYDVEVAWRGVLGLDLEESWDQSNSNADPEASVAGKGPAAECVTEGNFPIQNPVSASTVVPFQDSSRGNLQPQKNGEFDHLPHPTQQLDDPTIRESRPNNNIWRADASHAEVNH